MLVLVADLAVVDADGGAARRTELDVHFFEAGAAVGLARFHEVALAAEQLVAVEAGKVGDVPRASLGLGALVREDYFVAGGTPRLKELGVVPAAVDVVVGCVVKVD
ncbi:hypothetical protein BpHYR1_002287 [Brachionus plicatilis]|uniref:Uncharacterized protein n=1 Tax=Brachionus plicatilis TaxID=10195 RepID=A0A3M7PVH9_BRAPC|nr:hypothetical protein BpHYR1_002287 [Brachionus plicatilis]